MEFENALKNGDSIKLGNLYTIDAEILNSGSPSTVGRDNIIKDFGSMIRDSITGLVLQLLVYGEMTNCLLNKVQVFGLTLMEKSCRVADTR